MAETAKRGLGIDDIIGDKREAVLALAAKYGAFNVRVFGSVARGEARPDSDVDFVMEFPDGTSIFDLAGLWDELQTLLGREVDLVTPHKRLKDYMRREIERDAISL
jgi:predicted nucleotidyltransferase